MQKKISKKNKKIILAKGFSLVEVLLAIAILAAGLSAITALMASNIKIAQTTKNEIIASMLAQEGVELVRNFKENIVTTAVDKFSTKVAGDGFAYVVDYNSTLATFNVSNGLDNRLYLSAGSNLYSHANTGTPTKFFRKLTLTKKTDASSVTTTTVTAFVTWNGTGFGFLPITDAVSYATALTNCNILNKCVAVISVMPDGDITN